MRALRWIEAGSGVLASVVSAAFMIRLSIGPSHVIASSASCQGSTQSAPCVVVTESALTPTLGQAHGLPSFILLAIILILLVAIAYAAVWHSLTHRAAARGMLWGSAGLFILLAVWAMVGMDILLEPSVALALVASLCALAVRDPAVS